MDKTVIAAHFDELAPQRAHWFYKNRFYHDQLIDTCRSFMKPDSRVLELGCSSGQLLGTLNPSLGVGIDISPVSIKIAQSTYPHLNWICGDVENMPMENRLTQPFDIIIISDLLGYLDDIQTFLELVRRWMHPKSHIIISNWNWLWGPVLRLAEKRRLKMPDGASRQNWISSGAIKLFFNMAGYEIVQSKHYLPFPYAVKGISSVANRLANAPILNHFALLVTLVGQAKAPRTLTPYSVSVVIPTRNEVANIEHLVARMPTLGTHTEIIFVDGNSTDGTIEKIHHMIRSYPKRSIKFVNQVAVGFADTTPNMMLKLGKGDAVRKGFQVATGDILMIVDGDISVAPEDLPKFYNALASGQARFANGTRFIYIQENRAMKFINRLGNKFLNVVFSWMLSQQITDTLCGTKALFKSDYDQIAANRSRFGDFDPFGDFDLLFGAAWLGHRFIDVPVRYWARRYGESKVRVTTHGLLLGQMILIGVWHFKIKTLMGNLSRKIQF